MKKNLDFESWDLWDEFCARQDKKYKTPEEWVIVAKQLAEEHRTLPTVSWLQKNGYSALDRAMRKQPDLFKHIIQDKKYKTPEEWVIVAEELAEEHDRILPNPWWLEKNKYAGLDQAMRKQPDLFKHIIQDKKIKTPEEWVIVAEELAEEHDRILPNARWLQKNQYGLYQAMKKHPDLFKHIKRDWFKKC